MPAREPRRPRSAVPAARSVEANMSEDAQMLAPAPNSDVDQALLPLPEVLDLAAAERLYALMTGLLENGGPMRIDASAVETLTYPCVQIILAAMRTYDGISIKNPST